MISGEILARLGKVPTRVDASSNNNNSKRDSNLCAELLLVHSHPSPGLWNIFNANCSISLENPFLQDFPVYYGQLHSVEPLECTHADPDRDAMLTMCNVGTIAQTSCKPEKY